MRIFAIMLTAALPGLAFAAGGGGDSTGGTTFGKPKATETTQDCYSERQWDPEQKAYVRYSAKVNGVWDPQLKKCIRPDKAGYLDSNLQSDAVRELAYAGRLEEAQMILANMDQEDDLVKTYWGFTHRRLGNLELAEVFYQDAIATNPDNILARSYMAQGYVEQGRMDDAIAQYKEIQSRGGEGTWAEVSLRNAIQTGITYDY